MSGSSVVNVGVKSDFRLRKGEGLRGESEEAESAFQDEGVLASISSSSLSSNSGLLNEHDNNDGNDMILVSSPL